MRAIIRVDASNVIGSGHVIRCKTLGRRLREVGYEVVYVMRRLKGDLISLIASEFDVVVMEGISSARVTNQETGGGNANYRDWIGCSETEDAEEMLGCLKSRSIISASVVIVDSYSLGEAWESEVSRRLGTNEKGVLLVAIDDLANRRHQADIVVDQNYYGAQTEYRYESLVKRDCSLLLGVKYALIGEEYCSHIREVNHRVRPERCLVYFGGSDIGSLTERVTRILIEEDFRSIKFQVISGRMTNNHDRLVELAHGSENVTVQGPIESLAGVMAAADFCIGAGGSTNWERACMGLPSIIAAVADNQKDVVSSLERDGYIKRLKIESEQILRDSLREGIRILGEDGVLEDMSRRLYGLCDGNGCMRVAEIIKSYSQ